MPGQYTLDDLESQSQQAGQYSATDVAAAPEPGMLEHVGNFVKALLPHGSPPPQFPAKSMQEFSKLPQEQQEAYHKNYTDWQAGEMGKSIGLAAGFIGGPKAIGAAASAAGKVADVAAPESRLIKPAAQAFQQVMGQAKDVAVDVAKPGNIALKIDQLTQRGRSMPQVIRKFLARASDPTKGPLTYEEARDFYSAAGEVTSDEASRMSPTVRHWLNQFRIALGESNQGAASSVGEQKAYDYAMRQFATGKQFQGYRKQAIKYGLKYALPAGVAGVVGRELLE